MARRRLADLRHFTRGQDSLCLQDANERVDLRMAVSSCCAQLAHCTEAKGILTPPERKSGRNQPGVVLPGDAPIGRIRAKLLLLKGG